MGDGRGRLMLAMGLVFVVSAMLGLQSIADPVWGSAGSAPVFAGEAAGPPVLPSFSERLQEAGSVQALTAGSPDGWVPVAPGVDYQLFVLPAPNNVHVARMDRAVLGLFLETSLAQGRLSGGFERTSSMFARYDGAINYWDQSWGKTNDVLVAINGSFYDQNGIPDRGVIHSGWFAKRFSDNQNGSGFVWKLDRTAFIGECIFHSPANQIITYANSDTEKFQGINRPRGEDELVIYTPQYNKTTLTDASGVEVLVELSRPMLIIPPSSAGALTGTVRLIRDLKGNTIIPFDYLVLSATGTMRAKLLENLSVGDTIRISNSIASYEEDCDTPLGVDWTKAYASLGGSFYFLKAGVIQSFTDPGAAVRNPRTAIAYNQDYIYFIVVDGRDPGVSEGMTIPELAGFALNTLGATYGINQDGGGSSTMVIDGLVVNTPSDLSPVACTDYAFLPLISRSPGGQSGQEFTPDESLEPLQCYAHTERAVANGLMMVSVVPLALSEAFTPGQQVAAPSGASVYQGPGTNYGVLATVPAGESGAVAASSSGLNGVYAKGQYWWLVDFNSVDGWVAEAALVAVP